MRPLLALSAAIDVINEKIGYVCNFLVLTAPTRRSGLSSAKSESVGAPFQRGVAPSIGKWAKRTQDQTLESQTGRRTDSTTGHAHMPVDAWAIVPAINDEVVALRLEPDGAVDCRGQEVIVGGCP